MLERNVDVKGMRFLGEDLEILSLSEDAIRVVDLAVADVDRWILISSL